MSKTLHFSSKLKGHDRIYIDLPESIGVNVNMHEGGATSFLYLIDKKKDTDIPLNDMIRACFDMASMIQSNSTEEIIYLVRAAAKVGCACGLAKSAGATHCLIG